MDIPQVQVQVPVPVPAPALVPQPVPVPPQQNPSPPPPPPPVQMLITDAMKTSVGLLDRGCIVCGYKCCKPGEIHDAEYLPAEEVGRLLKQRHMFYEPDRLPRVRNSSTHVCDRCKTRPEFFDLMTKTFDEDKLRAWMTLRCSQKALSFLDHEMADFGTKKRKQSSVKHRAHYEQLQESLVAGTMQQVDLLRKVAKYESQLAPLQKLLDRVEFLQTRNKELNDKLDGLHRRYNTGSFAVFPNTTIANIVRFLEPISVYKLRKTCIFFHHFIADPVGKGKRYPPPLALPFPRNARPQTPLFGESMQRFIYADPWGRLLWSMTKENSRVTLSCWHCLRRCTTTIIYYLEKLLPIYIRLQVMEENLKPPRNTAVAIHATKQIPAIPMYCCVPPSEVASKPAIYCVKSHTNPAASIFKIHIPLAFDLGEVTNIRNHVLPSTLATSSDVQAYKPCDKHFA